MDYSACKRDVWVRAIIYLDSHWSVLKQLEKGGWDMLWCEWIWEVVLALINLVCHFSFYLLLALDCQTRLLYCVLFAA